MAQAASAGPRLAARSGNIEIMAPYAPAPASPDTAAVYLTIKNLGSRPDSVLGVSSAAAGSASLHDETSHGMTGAMVTLSRLNVPPHGAVVLTPGHRHIMLNGLKRSLRPGQSIILQVRFALAGEISVKVPIVPIGAVVAGGAPPPGRGNSSMHGMPGMD